MTLKVLPFDLTVCKTADTAALDLRKDFFFIAKTDEEISLVCRTADTPVHTTAREDGWRVFRIEGTLDFSLVGILANLSGILAENGIGLFAVSTYNTDYILVKRENLDRATAVLSEKGFQII